ncbi:MAG: hypothetical protein NTZ85_01555 [Bacteroidia bacterium]|nr:hypothetical protein [Bacteroidia bacterium]
MATITNINGTSDTDCRCGSWLNHWFNYNGGQSLPTYCSAPKCIKKDLVGAHVQKANSIDKEWYIVPLCQEHNKYTSDLVIPEFVNFAPASKKKTCER